MTTASAVRERPILFSGQMIRAILDGRKTQTRRVVTPGNAWFGSAHRVFWKHADFSRAWVDGRGSGSEYLHVPVHNMEGCEGCAHWGWDGTSHRLRPKMAPARCWDQEADDDYTPLNPMNRREFWALLCAAFGYAVAPKTPAPPIEPPDDQPVFTPTTSELYLANDGRTETWYSMSEDGWTHFTTRYTANSLPDKHFGGSP